MAIQQGIAKKLDISFEKTFESTEDFIRSSTLNPYTRNYKQRCIFLLFKTFGPDWFENYLGDVKELMKQRFSISDEDALSIDSIKDDHTRHCVESSKIKVSIHIGEYAISNCFPRETRIMMNESKLWEKM